MSTSRTTTLVLAALLSALSLSACGGTTERQTTTASIFDGTVRPVALRQVQQSIDQLYRRHRAVRTFVVRDVGYTARTRDRVLSVCSRGGAEIDRGELETSKVFACAPLIFFFERYGRQRSVPESVDVARQLYWYALTHIQGPYDAKHELARLLRSWGVQ
jgi:hypothetical protein